MKKKIAMVMTAFAVVMGVGFSVPMAASAQTPPPPVCKKVTVPPAWPAYKCINFTPGLPLNKNCYSTTKTVCSG